jgi:hypothetical protein
MEDDKTVGQNGTVAGDWEVPVAMFQHQVVMVDSESYP